MLHVPPPQVSFNSHRASYRFYQDDCLKILGGLRAGSIDVIVTSSPYNLGVRYRSGYQDPSNIGRWRTAASGVRCSGNTWFIPYDTIQDREKEPPAPGNVSATPSRDVPAAAWPRPDSNRCRSVPRPWLDGGGPRAAGRGLHRYRARRRHLERAAQRTRAALDAAS